MTDKTPKLLVDALGAIELAQEFITGGSLDGYTQDKMRAACPDGALPDGVGGEHEAGD